MRSVLTHFCESLCFLVTGFCVSVRSFGDRPFNVVNLVVLRS